MTNCQKCLTNPNIVRISIVKESIKHSSILYKQGHIGKGDTWTQSASLAQQHKMAFKANGVRDWMREYLKDCNKEHLTHFLETLKTDNKDGKQNEMHELERCTLDLLDMIEKMNWMKPRNS